MDARGGRHRSFFAPNSGTTSYRCRGIVVRCRTVPVIHTVLLRCKHTSSYTAPQNAHVFQLSSHTHRHGGSHGDARTHGDSDSVADSGAHGNSHTDRTASLPLRP